MRTTRTDLAAYTRYRRTTLGGTFLSDNSIGPLTGPRWFFQRSDVQVVPPFKRGSWNAPKPYYWNVIRERPWVGTGTNVYCFGSALGTYSELGGWGGALPTIPAKHALLSATVSQKDKIQNQAIIKALGKLKDQKVNLAQAFAEREQTINLLVKNGTKVFLGLEDVIHGRFIEAARRFGLPRPTRYTRFGRKRNGGWYRKNISQAWLELQYGWLPLLSDVYGSAEALAEHDLDNPDRYNITVKAMAKVVVQHEKVRSLVNATKVDNLVLYSDLESEAEAHVRLDYIMVNDALRSLQELGITNPLNLAWELLPYSFAVDWFLPVGAWLQTLDAALGLHFRGGSMTVYERREARHQYLVNSPATGSQAGWRTLNAKGNSSNRTLNRTIFVESPLPKHPSFKNPMSWTHLANFMSLLGGRRSKSTRI